ncbi:MULTISPECIES: glutamate-1-semialdehyde 2,1-aminomutase [unclassified Tolypothrix]|uniref:glutamate-1-semialdehyde 2,1-aminomutase n=1 Tax=unclassified Tolypothrix TaxID=2649714 RepID=UPI0005EAC5DF|nr:MULTISPECIES: glutamate-1-semialdehyde 2,1-aminomutase [unclassified Tolypothrix]BAY92363.1 aminotransferase, Class III pyridoxal-phosphate dependent [Microchaete diplosiphon NIES-3275]EKE98385.1 aminotransferase, class III [Tolypothrix sp. PCC 7601]MBE9083884.1 glutamate-1-semialdehyde 2,1-aminomutase [Tolypothrix sp. LEGE 11397]UYD26326.1 glutamate-1-semialdehyde 2,1-aminomutase [Tolypothrix sp. PCC 7712]UYD31437.1 glutamate-1-semialdehyde 2,1-aminomutase [Tolypothrix sp. PCC 7601]
MTLADFKPSTTQSFAQSKVLQKKSHALIPGGAHTYAKGDDQFPEDAPGFIVKGNGCHVWDVDGNEFIEYGMGLRAITLGHAYPAVVEAAYQQMLLGNNFTRPATIEVECAEQLLSWVPGAEMVKFAKDGSTVTTAAITLARAYTGRDMVAICGDHPFFSYNDWFIGSTPMSAGIPQVVQDLTVKFTFNDIESVKTLFANHPGKIACVILEPAKYEHPANGFLYELQKLCQENGAIFILDEMITGFRWAGGNAQNCYNIVPDLSTFGKSMGNGFAVSALAGKREIMELGGIYHDKERVFLLSTTHGAENHALAAAIATMNTFRTEGVIEYLYQQGERLSKGIKQAIAAYGVEDYFQIAGLPCNLVYGTRDQNQQPSQAFRTLFMQETIKRGLILPSLVVSFSHSNEDIDFTIDAIGEALKVYRQALEYGIDEYLIGRPVKPVFRKYC